jgi:hypothetical protein
MAKQKSETKTLDLEALATNLEELAAQATEAGEPKVARSIGYSVKSARFALKQRTVRAKRVGTLVTAMKAKGLSDAEIVAELTR